MTKKEPMQINDELNQKYYLKHGNVLIPVFDIINNVYPKTANYSDIHRFNYVSEPGYVYLRIKGAFK
jgi:hypothetical protein